MGILIAVILSFAISTSPLLATDSDSTKKIRTQKRSLTIADNPLKRGRGKLVAGILTVALTGAYSFVAFLFLPYCNPDREPNEYDNCKKTNLRYQYTIGGVALGGLAIGVPIIVSGVKDRNLWKQWNRENVEDYSLLESKPVFQNARYAARFARSGSSGQTPGVPFITYEF